MKTKSKTSAISGMAVNLIGGIVLLLAAFGVIAGVIGFVSFTSAMKKEYDSTTYHMADTAATVVNGDHIGAYLEGRETEEYARTKSELGIFCKKLHVSLIYVIAVDQSDYGRFVSVFNLVDNSVDNSTYVPWKLASRGTPPTTSTAGITRPSTRTGSALPPSTAQGPGTAITPTSPRWSR